MIPEEVAALYTLDYAHLEVLFPKLIYKLHVYIVSKINLRFASIYPPQSVGQPHQRNDA